MLFWQNYLYEVTGLLYWDTISGTPRTPLILGKTSQR
jgi:hypothetical protein